MIRFHEAKPALTQRAIPDSLRFTASDVERQSGEFEVDFSAYHVLRLELPLGSQSAGRLKKPLQTVFSGGRVCFMNIDRRQAYAVICQPLADLVPLLRQLEAACTALTGQSVNIGVSMPGSGEAGLPVAFRQADAALEIAFFQPEVNLHLFYAETCLPTPRGKEAAQPLEPLAQALRGGETDSCRALLEDLFYDQRSHLHPQEIREEGERVLLLCLDELARMDGPDQLRRDLLDAQSKLEYCPTFALYCDLIRQAVEESCAAISEKLRAGGGAVLNARSYIEENFRLPISLGEVAAAIGVNPNYLSRSYKSKMGISLVDSINRKKVAEAQELLALGRLKISEVAAQVGVEDTAYFSHLFRKYTGMSPRSYQKCKLHGEPVGEKP